MRCDKPMTTKFPFLLGRAFIEAQVNEAPEAYMSTFPFLLGRAFIEAAHPKTAPTAARNFPSF